MGFLVRLKLTKLNIFLLSVSTIFAYVEVAYASLKTAPVCSPMGLALMRADAQRVRALVSKGTLDAVKLSPYEEKMYGCPARMAEVCATHQGTPGVFKEMLPLLDNESEQSSSFGKIGNLVRSKIVERERHFYWLLGGSFFDEVPLSNDGCELLQNGDRQHGFFYLNDDAYKQFIAKNNILTGYDDFLSVHEYCTDFRYKVELRINFLLSLPVSFKQSYLKEVKEYSLKNKPIFNKRIGYYGTSFTEDEK